MSDFVTPAQLAEKYPVSTSTIYSACLSGLLPHYRVPARRGKRGKYLIRETDFLAWLESNRKDAGAHQSASAPASAGVPAMPFSELNPKRLARAWKKG